jgi:hypothetical protein
MVRKLPAYMTEILLGKGVKSNKQNKQTNKAYNLPELQMIIFTKRTSLEGSDRRKICSTFSEIHNRFTYYPGNIIFMERLFDNM